eukprot:TRINITY_DN5666_c0_g5_i2.p1 TRINITY_DN5666_c0_g5~~TRINITY_DN5666_c0_g5_i2.p1  ORF type:complete len:1353 (-),score=156.14 TRINITY_DN5666_c0_g5_i2:55-3657(-)
MEDGSVKLKESGLAAIEKRTADLFHSAPELLDKKNTQQYSKQADVFALGMIINELTRAVPCRYIWSKARKTFQLHKDAPTVFDPSASEDKNSYVAAVLLSDYRPIETAVEKPERKLLNVTTNSMATDPALRPSATSVYSELLPALLQRLMRNKHARHVWLSAVQLQAEATDDYELFAIGWEYFIKTLYEKHMGLWLPTELKPPAKLKDKNAVFIMGALFIRELVTEMDYSRSSSSTINTEASPASVVRAILASQHQSLRQDHLPALNLLRPVPLFRKRAKGVVSEKGINLEKDDDDHYVPLEKFMNFMFWFPLLRGPKDTTLLHDVVGVIGHKYFQIVYGTAEANRLLAHSKTGTFLMRFSGEAGSFAISYVLERVQKPKPRTEIRHCRVNRMRDGKFTAVICDKTQSFTSLEEMRVRLTKEAGLVLSRPYEKKSDSTMDQLRAVWAIVAEEREIEDTGYRDIAHVGLVYGTTTHEAIEAGFREVKPVDVEMEKEGVIKLNGRDRYVIIRDGVLMIYSGTPIQEPKGPSIPILQKQKRSYYPISSMSTEELNAFVALARDGTHPPHTVLVLDGGTVTQEMKGETSFKIECTNWSGTFSHSDVSIISTWANTLSYWRNQGRCNRYGSFCPPRQNIQANWLVDGKDTYMAMYEAIQNAKASIFLADWFMIAQIYLKRDYPPSIGDRLDKLIQRKAAEGVSVYVLLYGEMSLALKLNSQHTEKYLRSLHSNIHVIRHPFFRPFSWSHHQKIVVVDEEIAFVGGLDICFGRWDLPSHPLTDNCHLALKWPGKDYMNSEIEGLQAEHVEKPFFDTLDRNTQNRMPWHDIHMSVRGQAARDVALNFIQRWNSHRDRKAPEKLPPLVPVTRPISSAPNGTCECQVLRSIDKWSGSNRLETSILEAYLDMIKTADHFIYIENQFFISSTAGGIVSNTIAQAIVDRIILAHEKKDAFRVIIILPNSPEGNIFDAEVKFVMKWWYDTVVRGENSMVAQLLRAEIDPAHYLSLHGLRNWGVLDHGPVTQQIYVHCKCMIVDDRVAIIGSANINDRSMLGMRDSEIAIVTRDTNMIDGVMDGKPYRVGTFAHTLRKNLWREHLGIDDESDTSVVDPVSHAAYFGLWKRTSTNNSQLFASVFGSVFTDAMTTLKEYSRSLSMKTPTNCENILTNVKGHLVDIPLKFLSEENLSPGTKDLSNVTIKVIDANIFT